MISKKKASPPKKPADPPKVGAGRPTKYRTEYCKQASKLCSLGAVDSDLADFFEVSVSTINLWKVQHKEFSESLQIPKAEADARVTNSLYRRAVGYEHDEVDIRVVEGQIVKTEIRKHYPPDTTACIYWTKNRQPEQWRDKVEQDIKAKVEDVIDKEDLARRVIFLLSQRLSPT